MEKSTDHDAIRRFMERAAAGEDSPGRKMKYDPKLKRFVVVDAEDPDADDLPEVTPEDLQSFGALSHVVLHEAPIRKALSAAKKETVLVRLATLDGGDVLRVDGSPGVGAALVPEPSRAVKTIRGLHLTKAQSDHTQVVVMVSDDGLKAVALDGDRVGDDLPVRVVPAGARLFDRHRGVFETDALKDRKVGIVGVGSGGSFIARELAKAGVGSFVIIDHDRLEVGNVCRHECGLSDVGRLKVNAVAAMIRDRNPQAKVTSLSDKVSGKSLAAVRKALKDIDVLVVATDNRESRLLINRVSVELGVPTLFAAVFRRAYGGQVLRTIPGLTPCYQCFVDALPEAMEDQEISSAESADAIAYSDRPVAIEPGLSTDLLPVALQVVKLATLDLLGADTTFAHLREELVTPLFLWLNRREPGTDYEHLVPFENNVDGMSVLRWYGIYLPRNEHCPACGAYEDAVLGKLDIEVQPDDVAEFDGSAPAPAEPGPPAGS